MDVHIVPGVKAIDVAQAHRQDLLHQEEYGCKCMTYWIDEERENIFCLIDAPDKQAVKEMHSKSHGLLPNKIIEVDGALVSSFLGRIYDPESAEISDDGLKVFADPSFRIFFHFWCSHHGSPQLVLLMVLKQWPHQPLNLMESFGLSLFCLMSFQ
jgi:hypothetical protein